MKKKRRVLVFPGGTEIGLEIRESLKDCKEITLCSAGSNISNHAPYVFKNHFIVPDVHTANWMDILSRIIDKHEIDYIFPAHDDVIVALSQNAENFTAGVISSPLPTCLICRSKTSTYHKFSNLLPVPTVFDKLSDIHNFPVFIKPDKGQGSQGAFKANDIDTLRILLKNNPNSIIFEYLSGKEYTVDCFTDRRKGLLFCNGRERIRVRNGIAVDSKPADEKTNEVFREYANIISQELEFHGAWFFQLKVDSSGTFKLLEIAPRISGTMAIYRVLGVNFSLLSIFEKEGIDLEIIANNKLDIQIDRALVNRYAYNIKYNKVYVDLDDTIVVNGRVNTRLVGFLFQAINEGCEIILISKTAIDMESALKKWRLTGIFDKVIELKKDDSKADFIDPRGAIFIDDSFSERKSVYDKYAIPTFDCSMIELLLNERV
jgi:hypothetical protein